jgi:hypothetical protein
VKAAAIVLAALGVLSVTDGRYRRAAFLAAIAAGTAVAGHVQRQRRGLRPWQ